MEQRGTVALLFGKSCCVLQSVSPGQGTTWDALETYLGTKSESCANTWLGTDLHLALTIHFSICAACRLVTVQAS